MLTVIETNTADRAPDMGSVISPEIYAGEQSRYRDLDTREKDESCLRAYDLFSIFTANIILLDVPFTR